VEVGLEVPNHVKFLVCFYLFSCSYFVGVLEDIIFLVCDFLTFNYKILV